MIATIIRMVKMNKNQKNYNEKMCYWYTFDTGWDMSPYKIKKKNQ